LYSHLTFLIWGGKWVSVDFPHSFLFCFATWYWGSNPEPHTCKANALYPLALQQALSVSPVQVITWKF
jgi:hypothetical protein